MATFRVRNRTLAHLDRLIAVGIVATACNTHEVGFGVVDPIPPPAGGDPPDKDGGTNPEVPATNGATTVPPVVEPPSDPGYAVVDPMPPPAKCDSFADGVQPTAEWMEDGTLRLAVSPGWRVEGIEVGDPAKARVTNATVRQAVGGGGSAVLVLAPGQSPITVTIPGTCDGKAGKARIQITWTSPPKPGESAQAVVVPEAR